MIEKKFSNENNIYFTSDSHWGHKNIIDYCNRPFSSVEEMDEKLIENWNNVISQDDIIFHLGDICFGGATTWDSILPKLNGHIHLILGNHCAKNFREGYRKYFDSVQEQLTIQIGKKTVILSHFPLLCYHGTWGTEMNVINLHGHCHLCKGATGKDIERLQYTFPTQYDVGVDLNDYSPISYNQVIERIKYQIENNTNELHWIK